jgi:hypothetical protein
MTNALVYGAYLRQLMMVDVDDPQSSTRSGAAICCPLVWVVRTLPSCRSPARARASHRPEPSRSSSSGPVRRCCAGSAARETDVRPRWALRCDRPGDAQRRHRTSRSWRTSTSSWAVGWCLVGRNPGTRASRSPVPESQIVRPSCAELSSHPRSWNRNPSGPVKVRTARRSRCPRPPGWFRPASTSRCPTGSRAGTGTAWSGRLPTPRRSRRASLARSTWGSTLSSHR